MLSLEVLSLRMPNYEYESSCLKSEPNEIRMSVFFLDSITVRLGVQNPM